MSEVNLFSGQGQVTQQGHRVSGGMQRQMRREVETINARAEVAATREQANAFAVSVAMTNTAVLMNQAEFLVRQNPATAAYLEPLLNGYVFGASRRLNGGI